MMILAVGRWSMRLGFLLAPSRMTLASGGGLLASRDWARAVVC
jgi:hypothetical protein